MDINEMLNVILTENRNSILDIHFKNNTSEAGVFFTYEQINASIVKNEWFYIPTAERHLYDGLIEQVLVIINSDEIDITPIIDLKEKIATIRKKVYGDDIQSLFPLIEKKN